MDGSAFDSLTKTLTRAGSRRRALGGLVAGALGRLGWHGGEDSAAHDLAATCKKKSGKARKKCLKKAKKHQAQHRQTSAPPPRDPIAVLTYQCPEPRESAVGGGSTTRFAQSFTAVQSGSLHQIRFGIFKEADTTGNYVVELLDLDVDGKPTNTVLAQATIPDASVPGGNSTLTASFSGPPLVAGIEYAAALSRPGAGFYCDMRPADDCAGSGFVQNPNGTGQFMPLGQDIVVSVTVLV